MILQPRAPVRASTAPIIGLILGTAAGLAAADVPGATVFLGAAFPCGIATALVVWRTGAPSLLPILVFGCAFAIGGALLGARASLAARHSPLQAAFERANAGGEASSVDAVLTGTLRADAVSRGDRVSLSLDARSIEVRTSAHASTDRQPVRGGVLISVGGDLSRQRAGEWRRGRTLRLPVRVRRPTRHLNPGALDEEWALARRGFGLVGTTKSGALVEVLARGSPWQELGGVVRARVRRLVAAHVGRWSDRSAAIVAAILVGDRAGLAPEMIRRLQEAGTYHTVAISGGNIAVLAALALVGFRWAGMLGRTAMLTTGAALLVYGDLVESSASVTRAVVMATVYLAARALDHRVHAVHALAVVAGILVVADPLVLLDPGFLLSFFATAGLIAIPAIRPVRRTEAVAMTRRMALLRHGLAIVTATVAAEVALLPIVATFFGRVTAAGLALNIFAIPAMAVAQIAGLAMLGAAAVSDLLATLLGAVAACAAFALLESASWLAWLPALSWRVSRPSAWVIVLYYASVVGLLLSSSIGDWHAAGRRRVRVACAVSALAAAGWILVEPWTVLAANGDGRLHVVFIDVGQGDAAFVRFPRGATMLVDTGGGGAVGYDIGDRVVVPLLKFLGVRRLDTLVLSHPDLDHAGGAAAVARELEPFDLWEGVPVPSLPLTAELQAVASSAGTRWTNVRQGHGLTVDDVRVVVHHPDLPDWERQRPRNDDSIVLELRWQDVSIVLTGDIGRDSEQAVLPRLDAAPLRVVKVPHHGSRTSSSEEFVRALAPRVAIVSAGRGNPFGHPSPEVVGRYEEQGAVLFRTDRDGAVTLETDGRRLDVSGRSGRQARFGGR